MTGEQRAPEPAGPAPMAREIDPSGTDFMSAGEGGTDEAALEADAPEAPGPEPSDRRPTAGRSRRVAGLALFGLGLLILISAGWVSWRTYQAYSHLQAAATQVDRLQSELKDVTAADVGAAALTVGQLQQESGDARSAVADPVFRAAGHLPWLGPNLRALGEVTATVDSLANDVMPSLVDVAATLKPSDFTPKNGVVNLAPIVQASPRLQQADAAVRASRHRLAGIDRSRLIQPVNDAVNRLLRKLDEAASVTGSGARAARLLPPMLGANGTRTYIIAFQNLAETRATGGIFGSFSVVSVDKGKITMVDHASGSRALRQFDPPIAELPVKTTDLYSKLLAVFPQDVNLTPDFPTAAGLFAKMYTYRKGVPIDGVIATDPVALSYALRGTGPIKMSGGTILTSDNIVSLLLSTAYRLYPGTSDQSVRDGFLANAATVAFARVMSGSGSGTKIVAGIKQAMGERRVLVWSARGDEQKDIERTSMGGTLSESVADPTIGLFMNDGTGAKLDYYLDNSIAVTPGSCLPDGRRRLELTVTMRYTAPVSGLPPYVLGEMRGGKPYVLQTNVLVYAPVGGGLAEMSQDGKPIGVMRGEDRSREVGQITIRLIPGQTTVLKSTLVAPISPDAAGQPITPTLVLTPGVRPWTHTVSAYRSCSPPGR